LYTDTIPILWLELLIVPLIKDHYLFTGVKRSVKAIILEKILGEIYSMNTQVSNMFFKIS
jgi:hypothetical protein